MLECSRVKYSQVESRANVECSSQVEPSRGIVECSRVK